MHTQKVWQLIAWQTARIKIFDVGITHIRGVSSLYETK
jgi:hypothetical protein